MFVLVVLSDASVIKFEPFLHFTVLYVYLFLILLFLYILLEARNLSNAARQVEYRFSYDKDGIYREKVLLFRWEETEYAVFVLETHVDTIPGHHDVTWAPSMRLMKEHNVPDLTRRLTEGRIYIFRTEASRRKADLTIETTSFRPALLSMRRRMRRIVNARGLKAEFEYRRMYPDVKPDSQEGEPGGND